MYIATAAQIVRRSMLAVRNANFDGHFSTDSQHNSVPMQLLQLVRMILDGPSITAQSNSCSQEALSIAQLMQFNVGQRRTSTTDRHNMNYETPLPLYIGLLIYAKTRKRSLIDKLANVGLSVSYTRVLSVTASIENSLCDQYSDNNFVCPNTLRSNVFTTAACDNIDHNTSSTNAKGSFHGTGISLFQHPSSENDGEERQRMIVTGNSRTLKKLPTYYTDIAPVISSTSERYLCQNESYKAELVNLQNHVQSETDWLEHLNSMIIVPISNIDSTPNYLTADVQAVTQDVRTDMSSELSFSIAGNSEGNCSTDVAASGEVAEDSLLGCDAIEESADGLGGDNEYDTDSDEECVSDDDAIVDDCDTEAHSIVEQAAGTQVSKEALTIETDESNFSWAAYRAQNSSQATPFPCIGALLPLFAENSHSLSMIRHAMTVVMMAVNKLNPKQLPVVTFDQPLYALAKEIQWQFPDMYGENKVVVFFGALHVEMAFLKLLGQWLKGSGWMELIVKAGISSSGIAESYLRGCHVTRCRQAHTVTAASLYIMMKRSYNEYCAEHQERMEQFEEFNEWRSKRELVSPMFKYWSLVLFFCLCLFDQYENTDLRCL
jgi:hypothetical protein